MLNIDPKILNIILVNKIQEHSKKKSCTMIKLALSWRFRDIHKSPHGIDHTNGFKLRNYIRISIDTEKSPDETQHRFMMRPLKWLRLDGTHLNTIRAMYDTPTDRLYHVMKT